MTFPCWTVSTPISATEVSCQAFSSSKILSIHHLRVLHSCTKYQDVCTKKENQDVCTFGANFLTEENRCPTKRKTSNIKFSQIFPNFSQVRRCWWEFFQRDDNANLKNVSKLLRKLVNLFLKNVFFSLTLFRLLLNFLKTSQNCAENLRNKIGWKKRTLFFSNGNISMRRGGTVGGAVWTLARASAAAPRTVRALTVAAAMRRFLPAVAARSPAAPRKPA